MAHGDVSVHVYLVVLCAEVTYGNNRLSIAHRRVRKSMNMQLTVTKSERSSWGVLKKVPGMQLSSSLAN